LGDPRKKLGGKKGLKNQALKKKSNSVFLVSKLEKSGKGLKKKGARRGAQKSIIIMK